MLAGTEQDAAATLLNFLQDFVAKQHGMEPPPIDVDHNWRDVITMRPKSIAGLICHRRQSWKLGQGVGSGVMKAILKACMELIFSNEQHYSENPYTGNFIPLRPVVFHSSKSRTLQFATAGFFCMLYMIWTQTGPSMISGIFLQVITGDWSTIGNERLLQTLSPSFWELYLPLLQHPLDVPIPVQSPAYYLLAPALDGQQVQNLDGQSRGGAGRTVSYHQQLCNATAGYHLLSATRPEYLHHHSDVSAFSLGFNLNLANGQTFRDLLREKSTDIFPGMWCREIPSPNVFLQHLKIRPAPDEDYNIPTMSTQERIISDAIQRYFTIPGHPNCPVLRSIIPSHEFAQYEDDPALRARLFILAATGSRSTPTEPGWRVIVSMRSGN
ncbi:hypothetical protein FRC08_003746 [Ceratobasidium sp. 394]|nr:hypothetical protein FRC08_003746 [Ceratobasidium sp. 394]